MTDSSQYEYDWRRRLSHINMTDSDLTKYDWRQRLGDGGSGDYVVLSVQLLSHVGPIGRGLHPLYIVHVGLGL